jgi:hypothetical protein
LRVENVEANKFLNKKNMKTMKSKQFLFLAALGCMAAPVAAQTVDVSIDCGQSYPIKSTVDASAGGATITYRWLENGSTVTPEGEAYTSYTEPKTKSVGVYTYIRQARTEGCPDWQSSNAFTVEVKNKNDTGVCFGGVMWAKYNVGEPGSFTYDPEVLGNVYPFNRKVGYPPLGAFTVPKEDDLGTIWLLENDPCPPGWRVPSRAEYIAMAQATPFVILHTLPEQCGDTWIRCPAAPCSYEAVAVGKAVQFRSVMKNYEPWGFCAPDIWLNANLVHGRTSTPQPSATYVIDNLNTVRCIEATQ